MENVGGALEAQYSSAMNDAAAPYTPPSLSFESITFSDNTTLPLGPSDILALVGPNNAGKSAALRELTLTKFDTARRYVLKAAPLTKNGSREDLREFLCRSGAKRGSGADTRYRGLGYEIDEARITDWAGAPRKLLPVFQRSVVTQSRITDSNSVSAYDVIAAAPTHPTHLLFSDRSLERRLSSYFRRAFGTDLIFLNGGNQWSLYVGERPTLSEGEERTDKSYLEKVMTAAVPLHEQGDGMRSFASVILWLLATDSTMLLLDEPEAFLHPPQAKLLGEFIAKERPTNSQLILATHSQDILQALLACAPDHLRVVRMQREGSVNRVTELDKLKAKEIASDPLMRHSLILSGVFHERVIICESDADCMFYGALLDLPEVRGEKQPDVLFLHASGKHRVATLASALRALDVPVDAIVDMDILNDTSVMEKLVTSLGGDWAAVESDARQTKIDVEQHRPMLTSGEVAKGLRDIAARAPSEGEFPKDLKKEIQAIFRKASPWDAIKEAGESALPSGDPTRRWDRLRDTCSSFGLWIVPVGELENFDKSIGNRGPRWVQRVLEERDLAAAPELDRARQFVREVWLRRS